MWTVSASLSAVRHTPVLLVAIISDGRPTHGFALAIINDVVSKSDNSFK
jgi:hypothetical protein